MDKIERIEEERFVESLICLWIQPDAPEWIFDYARQELRKQRGLLKEQEAVVRCKDCINCIKEPNGELYCDVLAIGYEPLGSKK